MKKTLIFSTLIAALVLTLVFTCPDKQAHQTKIRNLITKVIDENPPKIIPQELLPVWDVLGSMATGQMLNVFLESQLEVRNYGLFSIGQVRLPDEKKTVSFGIMNKVYTFDEENIRKSWKRINESEF